MRVVNTPVVNTLVVNALGHSSHVSIRLQHIIRLISCVYTHYCHEYSPKPIRLQQQTSNNTLGAGGMDSYLCAVAHLTRLLCDSYLAIAVCDSPTFLIATWR